MSPALAIFVGSVVTFLLLLAMHLICWPYRAKMHRTHAYVVGVSCIGAGLFVTAALLEQWLIFVAFVGVGLPGGLLILAAWWVRGALGPTPADTIRKRTEDARAILGKPDDRSN